MIPLSNMLKRQPYVTVVAALTLIIGVGIAISAFVNAQTDASVTPLTPGWGGPNYDQPLWTITYDKAIIPVSFTSYHCTSAALVLEYATWADYTKIDWQTGATNKYTGFITTSASDLSQKVTITIPNLSPSTSYIFRVGAKCTSSSPMGSLAYTTGANQFATPAAPASKTYAGRAEFQYGDAGGSIENTTLLTQKVINLKNTGSGPDTFRTTLLVNPETRCGLRGPNDSYPTNTLPNALPTTLDTLLAVNETKYISAACVTKGLPTGPFTWGFKTVSVGALGTGSTEIIAEQYDTVNVTEPIPCNDADGGMNSSVKGIATGTYAGARSDYIAIYGQEPNPNTPKTTTEKFSTYIDHCSWDPTQLNEGFCGGDGRLQAIGIQCPNGCRDGVCIASPSSSSVSPTATSSSTNSSSISGCRDPGAIPESSLAAFGEQCKTQGLSWYSFSALYGSCRIPTCHASCGTLGFGPVSFVEPRVVCGNGGMPTLDFSCTTETNWRMYAERGCASYGGVAVFDTSRWTFPCGQSCNPPGSATIPTATGANVTASSPPPTSVPGTSESPPSASTSTVPSTTPSSPIAPPRTSSPPATPPHLSSERPNVQTEFTADKTLSKSKLKSFRKQQQTLRRELRSLERFLLRKKNVAVLGQVADLRYALYELDLHDPSAMDTLQSLQKEITDLRLTVSKKVKQRE